jgi:Uma2 family endonuclease
MIETPPARARLTREEYQALPEGPPYYELLDGELVEMTQPMLPHQLLLLRLAELWNAHLRAGTRGLLVSEPNLYLSGTDDVCHPDLVYVALARKRICRRDGIYGTPDVVCEILSPSTARIDRGIKREAYRQAGVPHLWLVDPERPVMVEEYVLGAEGRYELHAAVTAPAEWEPAAFPGWELALAELDAAVAQVDSDEFPDIGNAKTLGDGA